MAKRTVIAADEELLIQGQLTVVGNVVQVEETTIVTNFQNDELIINSDGGDYNATLSLRKNNVFGSMFFDGTNLEFTQPLVLEASLISAFNLKGNIYASDDAVLVNHSSKSFIGTSDLWIFIPLPKIFT